MAIKKEPDVPDDIPAWLMTFSDVITLLMTFFILLLTFATSEPESFDRMQVTLFGGGGSDGVAGKKDTSMDHDTVLVRIRSRAGRITTRGSEMPPIHTDPVYASLNDGLAGLEKEEQRELTTQHAISVPLTLLVDSDGQVTSFGRQHLKMIAQQLKRQPLDVEFRIADDSRLDQALVLVDHLYQQESVLPGRLAIGRDGSKLNPGLVKIVMTRPLAEGNRGS